MFCVWLLHAFLTDRQTDTERERDRQTDKQIDRYREIRERGERERGRES